MGWEEAYGVSSHGRVRRVGGGVLTPWLQHGYCRVTLSYQGRRKSENVSRLVLSAFSGPPTQEQPFALHGDGNRQNNGLSNLRWGSHSENMQDAIRHGTHSKAGRDTCKRGHLYTPENTMYRPDRPNSRICRVCQSQSESVRADRRRGSEPPTHGTPNAYSSYKCRCLICKTAYARYQKERRSHDKS